jgi:ectoine hydroxylase-related dioxygenase (phytanoyl-CoA dioxygenase family)
LLHDPERWIADYQSDGYLVVEDCIDPETLRTLQDKVGRILDDPESLPDRLRHHVQFERSYLNSAQRRADDPRPEDVGTAVRLVMDLPVFDPFLAKFIAYDPLLDVLQALFGSPEFHFHNYKCINKAPAVSSSFIWHRDLPFLYHSTPNLITAMVCLDAMTEENGATVVLPGSHKLVDENVAESDQDIPESELPEGFERRVVTCPAGSAVLFHVNILHGGPANRSQNMRRNVIGIWAGPDTYPTGSSRYAYQGLYPRSNDPARQKQLEMALSADH